MADAFHGLRIIDVSNPAKPKALASYDADLTTTAVVVSGRYAYAVGSDLSVIDMVNPADLQVVDGYGGFFGNAVVASNNHLYVAAQNDGLLIFNLYPSLPRIEATPRADAAGFHVSYGGEIGQTVRLQRSQDLKRWEDWLVLPATGSLQEVVDPTGASRRSQFYRVVVP